MNQHCCTIRHRKSVASKPNKAEIRLSLLKRLDRKKTKPLDGTGLLSV
jgi:hypothetical protein